MLHSDCFLCRSWWDTSNEMFLLFTPVQVVDVAVPVFYYFLFHKLLLKAALSVRCKIDGK